MPSTMQSKRPLVPGLTTVAARAFVMAGLAGAPRPLLADETHAHDPTDIWAVAQGGQLYDNWMSVMERDPPAGNPPAYPAAGKKKGASTWRCKECHGRVVSQFQIGSAANSQQRWLIVATGKSRLRIKKRAFAPPASNRRF